jgi:hypothetical protein
VGEQTSARVYNYLVEGAVPHTNTKTVEQTCTPEVVSVAKRRCEFGLPSLNLIYLLYENANKLYKFFYFNKNVNC